MFSLAHAAVIPKADNAAALNDPSSWVGGAVPHSTDTAQWDSTITSANSSFLGDSLQSWRGILIANPVGNVTINPDGNALSLGPGGIDMSSAAVNFTLGCDLSLSVAQSWAVTNSRTLTVSGAITNGAGGLVKTGPGTLILSGDNTYSGPTTNAGGTFQLGNNGPSGSIAGNFFLATNTLQLWRTDTCTPIAGQLAGNMAGSVVRNDKTQSGNELTLNLADGPNLFGELKNYSSGTLILKASAASFNQFTANQPLRNANTAGTLVLQGGTWWVTNLTANTSGSGTWCGFNHITNATLVVADARFLHGLTYVENGATFMLTNGSGNRLGMESQPGNSTDGIYVLPGAKLDAYGSSYAANINGTGANSTSFIEQSGGTVLIGINGTGSSKDLNIGSGTATAACQYNLYGGKLLVRGSIKAGNQSSINSFNWTNGILAAGTINMTGISGGTLTNTGGTMAPGDLGTPGKTALTGNYTQTSPGSLALDIGGTTQANAFTNANNYYDLLAVTGSALLGGGASVNLLNGYTPASTDAFTVVTTTVGLTLAPAGFAYNGFVPVAGTTKCFQALITGGKNLVLTNYGLTPPVVAHFTPTNSTGVPPLLVNFQDISSGPITNRHWNFGDGISLDTQSISASHTYNNLGTYSVVLTVSAPDGATSSATGLVRVALAGANLTWSGAQSAVWNLATANWLNGSSASLFHDNDSVTFDDTSSVTNVTMTIAAAANGVTFNNWSRDYTLNGPGYISDGQGITLNGGSSVTLLTTNDYVGPTAINAGTLQVGNGTVSGAIDNTSAITDNGALIFNQPDDHTINAPLSGSGSLTKAGAGTLTLNGANTAFYGNVTVNGGVLQATDSSGFGYGGTLTLGNGGIARYTAGPAYFNYTVTLAPGGGGIDHSLPITMSILTGTGPFIKAGSGTMSIQQDYSYTGGTIVNGGTLELGYGGYVGSVPGSIALNGGSLSYLRADAWVQNGTITGSSASSAIANSLYSGALTLAFAGTSNVFNSVVNNSHNTLFVSGGTNYCLPSQVLNALANSQNDATLIVSNAYWYTPRIASNNRGTNILVNATLVTSGGRNSVRGIWQIQTNGVLRMDSNNGYPGAVNENRFNLGTGGLSAGETVLINVADGGLLDVWGLSYDGLTMGQNVAGATVGIVQNGGTVLVGVNGTGRAKDLSFSAAGTNGITEYLLNAGSLTVAGSVWASPPAFSGTNLFLFNGGKLAVRTFNPTNLTVLPANTLVNDGGILAPGDTNMAGLTAILGDYLVDTNSAVLDIDLGGTAKATAFQHTNGCYDTVAVSGNATLKGSLRLRLVNGFEPLVVLGQSFEILTAANITGAFANVSSGSRLAVQGYPNRSFRVTVSSTNVVLDQYQTDMAQAYFTYGPAGGLAPLEVTFTNLSTGSLSNLWDFGDGATSASTAATVTHTYNVAGTNTVSLTVGNALGVNTYTVSNAVIVTDATGVLPVASFTATPLTGVRPLLVTFTDTSTDATTLAWDFGDGVTTNTTAGAVVQHIYLRENVYPVTLVATGAGGSSTNNSLAISVLAPNAPKVTSLKSAAGLLTIQGANGPVSAGQTYYYQLLTSTNVALARPNWTILSTNAFNPDGSFSNSLPVTPGEPRRFYLLQMP